jgi:hypothetical protein
MQAYTQVQLLCIPTYTCRLNLIEPWWKQLRSLALTGRPFVEVEEIIEAVVQATDYWNQRRYPYVFMSWKKPVNFGKGPLSTP